MGEGSSPHWASVLGREKREGKRDKKVRVKSRTYEVRGGGAGTKVKAFIHGKGSGS